MPSPAPTFIQIDMGNAAENQHKTVLIQIGTNISVEKSPFFSLALAFVYVTKCWILFSTIYPNRFVMMNISPLPAF